MTEEIFYPCSDAPGYLISNHGRVMSLSRTVLRSNGRKQTFSQRILRSQVNTNGYPTVTIRNGKKKRCLPIHRLVAKCFVVNHYKKPLAHHIDGNKKNNHYTNLIWATYSENIIHAYKTGLR